MIWTGCSLPSWPRSVIHADCHTHASPSPASARGGWPGAAGTGGGHTAARGICRTPHPSSLRADTLPARGRDGGNCHTHAASPSPASARGGWPGAAGTGGGHTAARGICRTPHPSSLRADTLPARGRDGGNCHTHAASPSPASARGGWPGAAGTGGGHTAARGICRTPHPSSLRADTLPARGRDGGNCHTHAASPSPASARGGWPGAAGTGGGHTAARGICRTPHPSSLRADTLPARGRDGGNCHTHAASPSPASARGGWPGAAGTGGGHTAARGICRTPHPSSLRADTLPARGRDGGNCHTHAASPSPASARGGWPGAAGTGGGHTAARGICRTPHPSSLRADTLPARGRDGGNCHTHAASPSPASARGGWPGAAGTGGGHTTARGKYRRSQHERCEATPRSHSLTTRFGICAESATGQGQPHCRHAFGRWPRLRRGPACVWLVLRIHAWDRLSVATRRQHTLVSVVAFRQTAGQPAPRMTDFGGQQ